MSNILSGIVASPGIRIGKAYLYRGIKVVIPKYRISAEDVEAEISRFDVALQKTKVEISSIQEQIATSLSNDMSDIFASHIMVLEDPIITTKAKDLIQKELRNVEWILNDISLELIQSMSSIKDDYLRERIIDLSDIHKRLISNLQKIEKTSLSDLKEEVIVFASELTPSDTAMMNRSYVRAFVTDTGGKTSHTAIMARALEIPAIVGTVTATSTIKNGDIVIVDGVHGKVIINPTPDEIKIYTQHQEDLLILERELSKLTHLPAKTVDDVDVRIYGNIEIPEEIELLKEHGAEGIGLFRSEFLFLDNSLPDEEKQFQAYKKVVEAFAPLLVTIRTIDVGGDKIFALTENYKERNPFLGCRAIRFSLANVDIFKTQLRAILRASAFGNVKLMFPMITIAEELMRAKEILEEVKEDLKAQGIPFDEQIQVGIMIEVPAAALNADILAKHSDFFSVGTNDLIQYTLAVDRIGEKVAYLYNPLDLSVIKLLMNTIHSAKKNNIPLSICGEMAGEPKYTMVLIGLGVRHLSMSTTYMRQIKRIIRSVTIKECENLVLEITALENASDIENLVLATLQKKFPSLVF